MAATDPAYAATTAPPLPPWSSKCAQTETSRTKRCLFFLVVIAHALYPLVLPSRRCACSAIWIRLFELGACATI
eukprot:297423-Rhodomonas_salina.2